MGPYLPVLNLNPRSSLPRSQSRGRTPSLRWFRPVRLIRMYGTDRSDFPYDQSNAAK